MMLQLSHKNVRRNWPLFAGSFVALALGVALLALSAILIWSVEAFSTTVDPADTDLLVALDDLMAMLGVVSTFSGFMAIFIVASTFGFAVNARQRELGLLRLVGATPKQVRRMILGESLVVGVVASVVGSALGWLLAPIVLWVMHQRGLAPEGIPIVSPWAPLAIASGIGLAVALLGARAAGKRAAKVAPIQAMRDAAVERGRIGWGRALTGVLCLVGSGAMLIGVRAGSPELAMVLAIFVPELIVIGLVCLGPVLIPQLVRLLTLGMRRHVLVDLARQNLLALPRRTTSLAAPILAISAIAGSLILSLSFAADWDNGVTRQQLEAPVVVTGADARDARTIEARPDVEAADNGLLLQVTIERTDDSMEETFEGIDPAVAAAARGTRVHKGDLGDLTGRTMAIARSYAWDYGIHLGDKVRVRFADGSRMRLRVVAEVEDANNLQQTFLMPRALAAEHGGEPSDTWFVVPTTGVPAADLVDDLAGELTTGEAVPAATWVADRDEDTRANNQLSVILVLGPAAVYAAIAIANTLLMGSRQRRHEFIATRLIGATEEQVRRLVVTEAGLVAGVALTLGAITTVTVGVLLRIPMTAGLDDVPLTIPWVSLGAILVACVVIPIVAAVLPARSMLRQASPANAATG
ncbi:FtsX-like permease family protein [Nocardioides alcanivorans]|uniref:FtsX-like permease family protein n=1 Tax=Nocardioides alcanivorans TaxID=2897352 RepID=UPI001F24454F|nr:ABC transporter permease [Nocardioides alcanivorans]